MAKPLRALLPLIILGVGVLLTVVIIKSRPKVEREPAEVVPLLVRVQEVDLGERSLVVESQGTVQPSTSASLVAEVPGKVVSVSRSFNAGGFFRKGEPLVRLDPRDYELAVTRAKAQLAQANVRLKQVKAEAEISLQEWEELGEGREPSALLLREPQIAEAEAAGLAAQASLEEAQLALRRTVLRAPYAGRVRSKQADVGQYVAPGQPLGVVYAVDYAEVRLPVPDAQLAFLQLPLTLDGSDSTPGPTVTLSADFAGQRQQWQGRIVRTEGEIDPRNRMVQLVARIEDPYSLKRRDSPPGASVTPSASPLAVGMFVQAEIQGPMRAGVVVLPRTALREAQGGEDQVMVLDGESRLRFRTVEVLRRTGTEAMIAAGLEQGEKVCVSPLETPVDGMKVRTILDETALEAAS